MEQLSKFHKGELISNWMLSLIHGKFNMSPCMLLKGSPVIDWLIERVSEWVSGWVGEWVSEWVNEWLSEWVNEGGRGRQRTHRRTTSHHSWYLPKWLNLICSVALNLRNQRTCVPLCVLDHPWRVFFLLVPAESTRFLILPGRLFTMPKRKSVLQVQCSWSDLPQ